MKKESLTSFSSFFILHSSFSSLLQLRAALLTRAQSSVLPELVDNRLELLPQVDRMKRHIVHRRPALGAVPTQVVLGILRPAVFHDQADGVGRPLRRMRNAGRQQK